MNYTNKHIKNDIGIVSYGMGMNVTGFGKTYIVHTSNFAHLQHLEIHIIHMDWYTDIKLLGIEEYRFY